MSVSSLNSVIGGSASSNLGAPTTVANGTIALGGSLPLPGVGNGGSTLQYTGTGETTDRVVDVSIEQFGTIEQAGTGLLEFTSDLTGNQGLQLAGSTSGRGEFTGAIGGTNRVSKFGTGTWTLSAPNTYSGETRVFGGTLEVDGDQSAATGEVTVHTTATLAGTGTVGGAVTVRGGTISPGTSVGTLILSSGATFREGTVCSDDFGCEIFLGTYLVDIFAATSDVLAIDGELDLSNQLDQISFTGTPDGTTTYLLATYASIAGTFDVANVPSGYQLLYGPNRLDLAPIPEPATIAPMALGLVAMAIAARRGACQRARPGRRAAAARSPAREH